MVGDVDGGALVTVLGGGVPEPDVLTDVLGRKPDRAVSPRWGHGQAAVGVGVGDGPPVAVPDRVTRGGGEGAVVAAGHHDLAHTGRLPTRDRDPRGGVQVARRDPGRLDGGVDGVDVRVCCRGDRHGAPGVVVVEPVVGEVLKVRVEATGGDPAVGGVGVEHGGVTVSQQERRGGLPPRTEPVHSDEFVDASGSAEFGEESAAADGLELAGVTHQHDPPPVPVGERDEVVEGGGADHARLIHDHRRSRRQPVSVQWGPVGAGVFVQELGDRVGGHPCLAFEDTGRLRRGRHPEHDPTVTAQVVDRGAQHGGLARPGRTLDQHERVPPSDSAGGVSLHDVEPDGLDGGRWCGLVGLAPHGPRDDVFFLGEDGAARVLGAGRFDPHRPAIPRPVTFRPCIGVEVRTPVDYPIHSTLQHTRPPGRAHRLRRDHVRDRSHDIGPRPRRPARRQPVQHIRRRHASSRCAVAGGADDVGPHTRRRAAELVGLGLPPCRQIGDTVAGLVRAGVDRGFAGERSTFPPRWIATFTTPELGQLRLEGGFDLRGPLGERSQEFVGDTGDLGLTVHDRPPHHAEPFAQPGP